MKKLVNISKNMVTFLSLVALFSCAAPREQIKTTETPDATESNDRGFDPMGLAQDREIVPAVYPRTGEIIGRIVPVEEEYDSTGTEISELPIVPDSRDTLNNQAFRVQIFTTKLYGEARQAARIAEEIFDRPVFIDYEVPYFKVRVGNFAAREEAEEYLQRTKAAGYRSAWLAMVNVTVKETAPLYDDGYPLDVDDLVPEDSIFFKESPDSNELQDSLDGD